jgi:hypothetical protein
VDGIEAQDGNTLGTVKIWDRASGNCLQTLHVGKPFYRLSFDPTGSNPLSTENGLLNLEIPSPAANFNVQMIGKTIPRPANRAGVGLSGDGPWVIKDGERMLRLPLGFRSGESAVIGGDIAIGCRSGRTHDKDLVVQMVSQAGFWIGLDRSST